MHDICREARVSPGALYIYFDSKEALIAGIAERDRATFAERLSNMARATDFLRGLSELGEQYFVDEPQHKQLMCIEIGVESTRNARVGDIYRKVDKFVTDKFIELFQRLKDEGRIAPTFDIATAVKVFTVLGDGVFWRRAIDPEFDARAVLPALVTLVGLMLNPVQVPQSQQRPPQVTPANP
jgi:AcrR family transcriptional regulator